MNAGREAFSERRYAGHSAWLCRVYFFGVLGAVASAFLGSGGALRLADVFETLVTRPLAFTVFALLAAFALARGFRLPVRAALNVVAEWAPLALVPAFADAILVRLGAGFSSGFVNAKEALLSVVTVGFLPRPLASLGTLATVLLVAAALYHLGARIGLARIRTFAAPALWLLGSTASFLSPSVIGWFSLSDTASVLTAGPIAVSRGWFAPAMESYWWRNIYERFPVTSGSELDVATRLWSSAFFFLLIAATFSWQVAREWRWSARTWFAFLRGASLYRPLALVVFGIGFAISGGAIWRGGLADLTAWLLFSVVCACAWIHAVSRNDLADIASDERYEPDRPLVVGLVSVAQSEELNRLAFLGACFGSLLLGWPVAAAFAVFFLAGEALDAPALRLKRRLPWNVLLQGLSAPAFFLAGWFFAGEHGQIGRLPSGLVPAIVISFILFGLHRDATRLARDAEEGRETLAGRLSPERRRWRIPVALAIGYGTFPLLTFTWKWLVLAGPIAAASAFFAFTEPQNERIQGRLLLVFFIGSALLAGSAWLQ